MTEDKKNDPAPKGALETLRLAKHLAATHNLSRATAEQYIEGGYVRVNGIVIESPQHRVKGDGSERIELDSQAKLSLGVPMTILWHKPAGVPSQAISGKACEGMTTANRANTDRSGVRLLQRHLKDQECVTPLETGASGLVVFTQDFPVKRKLIQDNALNEHEIIVDVSGAVSEQQLRGLSRPPMKVAMSKQTDKITGLRFAIKGYAPGSIAAQCQHVGLEIEAMKRIRVGRIPLAGLEVGQWRFLMGYERF
jgi:23S rRNA pseudouridine2604 synthase